MPRVPHKQGKSEAKTITDDLYIAFDTETREVAYNDDWSAHDLIMFTALFVNRTTGQREKCFGTTVEEFWDFVESKANNHRRKKVVLIAHNMGYDVRVLKWYTSLFKTYGWERGDSFLLPTSGKIPVEFHFKKGDMRIVLKDLANYWGMQALRTIGQGLGYHKLDDVDFINDRDRWNNVKPDTLDWEIMRRYCERDTEIVYEAINSYSEFVEKHDLGPLRVSNASQCMSAFFKKFEGEAIYFHNHSARLIIERGAYAGGAVGHPSKLGPSGTPVYEDDVVSMYPSVLKHNLYPYKTVTEGWGYRRGTVTCTAFLTEQRFKELTTRDICTIARVTVDIPRGTYFLIPKREKDGLLFPTGEFETTLTTPELQFAFEHGLITQVHEYSLYYGKRDLFNTYVDYFHALREAYKKAGNKSGSALTKLFLNSFYGKWGQFSYEWEVVEGFDSYIDDGEELNIDGTYYRKYFGVTERRSETKLEPSGSFPGIAAHVTAYARSVLREGIVIAGRENVYYHDTDSLHVTPRGHDNLMKHGLIGNDLGMFKFENHYGDGRPAEFATYRGCKDYFLDGKGDYKKGKSKNAVEIPGERKYMQPVWQSLAAAMKRGNADIALVGEIHKTMDTTYRKGYVAPDNTVHPWHYVNGERITEEDFYLS